MFRGMLLAVLVALVVTPAFGQEVLVFVTSGTTEGDLGGLSGADTICTDAATNAGLSGDWVAWLSTTTENARDRIIDARYVLVDGTVVANDLADLTDGTLDAAIDLDANGDPVMGFTWTGTQQDGTLAIGVDRTCLDWTDSGGRSTQGQIESTSDTWTDFLPSDCDHQRSLYCFAAFEVPVELQEFSVE